MRSKRQQGFTLIELLIVVAIIAVMASVAIPRFLGARRSANETSAIATMRAIFAAQMQAQAANSIDTDSDGRAEFGYFGELSGTVPSRISVGGVPAAGVVGTDELAPSPLISSLGTVSNGVVTRSGYFFQMWLPANPNPPPIAGVQEDVGGGKTAAPFPDPDGSETYFCAYAWPASAGNTGLRCFFINQEGVIYETSMRGPGAYSGFGAMPACDAAFTIAGDMSSPIASGGAAVDGNNWVPVQ